MQELAADGEAEAADAVGVDVGAGAQVVDAGEEVAVAGPADGVALAPALSAWVEQQDAVAVADQHPRLRRSAWRRGRGSPRRGSLDGT